MLALKCVQLFAANLRPSTQLVATAQLSTTAVTANIWRIRWKSTKKWRPMETKSGTIPWLGSLPMAHHRDQFSKTESYAGMYDYLAILGDDVTLQPKLFCKGPRFVRGHKMGELKTLLTKKRMFGHRMHLQDMDALNKRIRIVVLKQRRANKT